MGYYVASILHFNHKMIKRLRVAFVQNICNSAIMKVSTESLFTPGNESFNGCSLKKMLLMEHPKRYGSLQLTWRRRLIALHYSCTPHYLPGACFPTFHPLKVIGPAFTLFIAPTQFELNYFYGRANCYFVALSRLPRRN